MACRKNVCLMRGTTGSSHDARAWLGSGVGRPAFDTWLHLGGIPEMWGAGVRQHPGTWSNAIIPAYNCQLGDIPRGGWVGQESLLVGVLRISTRSVLLASVGGF